MSALEWMAYDTYKTKIQSMTDEWDFLSELLGPQSVLRSFQLIFPVFSHKIFCNFQN